MTFPDEVITLEALEALLEYSCSLPTGTTIGKRWRRSTKFGQSLAAARFTEWMIGTYVEHLDDTKVGIVWTWGQANRIEPIAAHETDERIPTWQNKDGRSRRFATGYSSTIPT